MLDAICNCRYIRTMLAPYSTRIYWEDTDAGGVVYYANYLKFAERARTELLRQLGLEQQRLREENGVLFVVQRCEIDYLKPARLDDLIHIHTQLQELRKVRMSMQQLLLRGDETLARLQVKLACVDNSGKPAAIPEQVAIALEKTLID